MKTLQVQCPHCGNFKVIDDPARLINGKLLTFHEIDEKYRKAKDGVGYGLFLLIFGIGIIILGWSLPDMLGNQVLRNRILESPDMHQYRCQVCGFQWTLEAEDPPLLYEPNEGALSPQAAHALYEANTLHEGDVVRASTASDPDAIPVYWDATSSAIGVRFTRSNDTSGRPIYISDSANPDATPIKYYTGR